MYTAINAQQFTRKLLVHRIPKKGASNNCLKDGNECPATEDDSSLIDQTSQETNERFEQLTEVHLLQEPLSTHKTVVLTPRHPKINLCHCNLCCNIEIDMLPLDSSNDTSQVFRFIVYSGVRHLGGGLFNKTYQVCGIVSCNDNESVDSCGLLPNEEPPPQTFNSISISGNFSATFLFPNTVDTGLVPLTANSFSFRKGENTTILTTTKPPQPFLTFAIYGLHMNEPVCTD